MEELTKEEVRLVNDYRNGFLGVYWHIDDFEARAIEKEEQDLKEYTPRPVLYDRIRFEESLLAMISDHDCNIGITWDTIDYYLNEYCLIEEV